MAFASTYAEFTENFNAYAAGTTLYSSYLFRTAATDWAGAVSDDVVGPTGIRTYRMYAGPRGARMGIMIPGPRDATQRFIATARMRIESMDTSVPSSPPAVTIAIRDSAQAFITGCTMLSGGATGARLFQASMVKQLGIMKFGQWYAFSMTVDRDLDEWRVAVDGLCHYRAGLRSDFNTLALKPRGLGMTVSAGVAYIDDVRVISEP